ncbi:hypothetical protein HDU86_000616, partial [Geranomyces michiganensis]
RKSEERRRLMLPLPAVVHKIDTRRAFRSETLNAKSARSGKQLKYRGAAAAAAAAPEEEDDVELDEAWLKPVQEKRRSRMILDASAATTGGSPLGGALGVSFGPGLQTLLRGTGAHSYLTSTTTTTTSQPSVSPAAEQYENTPDGTGGRQRRPSHTHIQATPQSYMTATLPSASPMMATTSRSLMPPRKPSGPEYPFSSSSASPTTAGQGGGGLILEIPHRSHSRNWSNSGTLSPLFSSADLNQSPFFTGAATAPAVGASSPTRYPSSPSAAAQPSALDTKTATVTEKSLPRLLQESQSLYAILGARSASSASSPNLTLDDLAERGAAEPVQRSRSRSKSRRRPTVESLPEENTSTSSTSSALPPPPRKSSESKRAARDHHQRAVAAPLTPPTSASPSPPPTFGAPSSSSSPPPPPAPVNETTTTAQVTLELQQPSRQVVVVSQSPTRLVAPLRAMTLTRHQSTPTMESNVVADANSSSDNFTPPLALSPVPAPPPPMSADSGYPRHPADLAPPSLHRTLTDPLFLLRRTPSPEFATTTLPSLLRTVSPILPAGSSSSSPSSSPSERGPTPLPNIPQRKPSLLSRAKTTLSKKSTSPTPSEHQQEQQQHDPDDPTIPPWNRLARSNSVKNGIIYDNHPAPAAAASQRSDSPRPATLARARTYNNASTPTPTSTPIAETEFRIPRSFTATAAMTTGGGGAGRVAVTRTNSTRAMQPLRAPRRANTLTATTALPAHFIHLKAQYRSQGDSHSPTTMTTILLKVSRTTALGVVTARLQEKFSAALMQQQQQQQDIGGGDGGGASADAAAAADAGIKVLGLTYSDEDGCQIEVCDDEDWMVLCAAAKGKVVVGVRVGRK